MIKKYAVILFCIQSFNCIIAQTPELVVNVSLPGKIAINGNDLFIAQENKISKIDLNSSNPSLVDFITNTNPLDLRVANGYMYVSESNVNPFSDKIYKVVIANPSTTATDLIINSSLKGIAINNNVLYATDFSFPNQIFKVDVTTIMSPTFIELTTIFNNSLILDTYNMFIHNNFLYLAQTDPDLISIGVSKIDLAAAPTTAPTTIYSGLNSIPRSFAIKDNYMYIALADNISRIDITEPSPIPTIVTTQVNNPQGLAIKDCNLYISERNSNKITKLDLCALSSNNINPNESISLYPNPSKNEIKISGLKEAKNYKIINILGIVVNEGIMSENENINIQNLSNGIYFLKFQNTNAIKFIKE